MSVVCIDTVGVLCVYQLLLILYRHTDIQPKCVIIVT